MSKGILAFGLCFLLICSVFIPISLGLNVKTTKIEQPSIISCGKTLYVGGSGPDNYTKIQEAINDAWDGDTVYVYNDSSPYDEGLNVVKTITIIGEDRETTIINGSIYASYSSRATISSFTIMKHHEGICAYYTNGLKIINNIICDNGIYGIYFFESINCLISNNLIKNNGYMQERYSSGIFLAYQNNCHIADNYISNNKKSGINVFSGNNIIISNNTVINNGNGGDDCFGIEVTGDNISIKKNHVSNNKNIGIKFLGGHYQITDNNILNNKKFGIYSLGSDSIIVRNNFINNPTNAYFEILLLFLSILRQYNKNIWDANYYSDYNGIGFYLIRGRIYFLFTLFSFPWFRIDWNPASEPYDIEGIKYYE